MSTAREIYDGWLHYSKLKTMSTVDQKIAEDRAKVCGSCPSAVKSDLLSVILPDNTNKEIQGYKCSECGCPLSSKVRSITSQCPLKKWKE